MSARGFSKTVTTTHDEGVVVTRSSAELLIRLPLPQSLGHQLGVIAVVWEMWKSAESDIVGSDTEWTVNISQLDEITFPLIAVMSAIDAGLCRSGKTLLVVGGSHTPSSEVRGA